VIVVDAIVIASYVLKEEGWEGLDNVMLKGVTLDYAIKEVANAIWKYYKVRRKLDEIGATTAYKALKVLMRDVLLVKPQEKYLDEAFQIALSHEITVYDSLYLAMAMKEKLPIITFDKKQAKVAREMGLFVCEDIPCSV